MADSVKEKEILDKVKFWYETAVTSSQYTKWRDRAVEDFNFYDGYQWTKEEIDVMRQRRQPVITMNQLAPKVDAVSGVEQTSRTVITYRPRTFRPDDYELAEAFTAIALNWQEIEDTNYKNSEAFKNMLICGVGWVQATKDQNGIFQYDLVDPYEMVWDVDDMTPDLSNQRYAARARFLSQEEAIMTYPDKKDYIEKLMNGEKNDIKTRSSFNIGEAKGAAVESYVTENAAKMLVVEVQYREREKFYSYLDANGRMKLVLDKKIAEKSKAPDTRIEEKWKYVTKYAHYTADILLDEGVLSEQDEHFEYIPMVFRREKLTGVPYGIVHRGKDAQREHNKRRSKMMHLLNTNQVLLDNKNTNEEDIQTLREQAAAPDGILSGEGIKLNNNLDLAQGQLTVYQQTTQELQQVMGVFDESLGQQTNATSGLAIQQRQNATMRTQSTSFDQFRHFKKRLGRKIMSMIQDIKDENFVVMISGDENTQIFLNQPYEVDGKTVYENDVTTANFDIVVEESIEYDAPPAEAAQQLSQIIMNGQLGVLAQYPQLAKVLGIRNADQLFAGITPQPSPDGQDGEAQTGGAI